MHGESAEGEREEPATNNINQNSSGWGRKNFKMLKKKAHKIHCWCVFLEASWAGCSAPPRQHHPPRHGCAGGTEISLLLLKLPLPWVLRGGSHPELASWPCPR